ncbi:hypothetical protein QC762_0077170 [Podospora pseudocomata]|uniref:NACHT domain-containing protein n=1 Tax=Podospora pseudocomata TaxID=2093779 RepID=A0ABR0GB20_9PEZI|nr:hypothetical protein QC762_0077170 [Podospora pseudocomata]
MPSVNLSQAMHLIGWTTALSLLAGAIVFGLWFYPTFTRSKPAPSSQTRDSSGPARSTRQDVRLCQVNPDKSETDTDIDIIAIHGLDTKSPDTWTWADPNDPNNTVNWLADPRMLPSQVEAARIFTCDWPADLLQPSDLVQKTDDEIALLLFEGIKRDLLRTHDKKKVDRPILFIASCLGGIILAKAIVGADYKFSSYYTLRTATRGIIFLATPFGGTSFEDVAIWADPGLTIWAVIRRREVSNLLGWVKGSTSALEALVRKFTRLCQDNHNPYHVFCFYELGMTNLWRKVFPRLPASFPGWKQLVDMRSATLQIVSEPLPLDRTHGLMNKFGSPDCQDYKKVAGKIEEFVRKIREGTPLAQADALIRNKHYSSERLKIERLSGGLLPMDRCYINLAIVERPGDHATRGGKGDIAQQSSPFSRSARLKVDAPDKNIQVELSALFDPRRRGDVETKPRRILIRGRAGVGKTTLCKKIIHEFTNGTWSQWSKLFHRVLWVPLRHLKLHERRQVAGYNFFHLLSHEYFSLPHDRPDLAKALSNALETSKSSRTLFLLDGLDEVVQDLDSSGDMSRFLKELLSQPNVIITSRPSGKLPAGVHAIDIELETIGFYPDQVNEYLAKAFSEQAREIQSFLEDRFLIQDLVRIPIQLDALCFTWKAGFRFGTKFNTMTAIYQAIENSLWKKDILRLEKKHDGELLTEALVLGFDSFQVEVFVNDEIEFLELLAFTGLHNDVIDFESRNWKVISSHLKHPFVLEKTLPRISFLRTSDLPSDLPSEHRNQSYHFLHLTYQEYFAARYFARQWKEKQPLECLPLRGGKSTKSKPATFLEKHKYDTRYDIFWRFVAGLLDADDMALDFFQMIEKEPRDLLGPTHQRLVMHCLSEVERKESNFTGLRARLENQLEQWLLFESNFTENSELVREMECPGQVLSNVLTQASEGERTVLLNSLSRRTAVPFNVIKVVSPWLTNRTSARQCAAILHMLGNQHNNLPDEIHQSIAARLEHEDESVRWAAIKALGDRTDLPDQVLQSIAARLVHEDGGVRGAAIVALRGRASLPDQVLQSIAARLEDKDVGVRWAVIDALRGRTDLPDQVIQSIVARLVHEDGGVRGAAIDALRGRAGLPDQVLQSIAARLEYKDWRLREAAIEALGGRADLPDQVLQSIAARLEDKDRDVRRAAIEALLYQSALSLDVLIPFIRSFYDALLQKSFREHLYWYASERSFIATNLRYISLTSVQHNVKEVVRKLLLEKGAANFLISLFIACHLNGPGGRVNIYLFVSSSIFEIFISHKIITHLLLTPFYIERQLSSRYHHAKRTIVSPLEGSSGLANYITLLPLRRMLIRTHDPTVDHDLYVDPLSRRLACVASDDNTIKIWDAATGSCTQTLEGHRHSVWSVASSLNSKVIASKSDDANPPHY